MICNTSIGKGVICNERGDLGGLVNCIFAWCDLGGVIWAHLVQMGVICHIFGQKGVIYQNIAVI